MEILIGAIIVIAILIVIVVNSEEIIFFIKAVLGTIGITVIALSLLAFLAFFVYYRDLSFSEIWQQHSIHIVVNSVALAIGSILTALARLKR